MEEKHLSTSALAKSLGKEPKELFGLLSAGGWILKTDKRWQLTEKGRFEGGITIDHPKFGEYIGWPESVKQHAILATLPESPLNASSLGKKLKVPARLLNLMLAELGWITREPKGWCLTVAGRSLGGQQQRSEKSGIPFATWPDSLLDNPHLLASVKAMQLEDVEPSLGLAGYRVHSNAARMIGNWLYLAELPHAYQRRLPVAESLHADFYLPQAQLYIEFWGDASSSAELKAKVVKQALYAERKWTLIELDKTDLPNLDELLPRLLLKHGVAVY